MKRTFLIACAASLALAIGLPFLTHAGFFDAFASGLLVLLGFVLMVVSLLVLLWGRVRGSATAHRRGRKLLAVGFVGLLQVAGLPVREHLAQQQEAAAHAYVGSLVPLVEQARRRTGQCPKSLQELGALSPAPAAFRGPVVLRATAETPADAARPCEFVLQFRLPGTPPLVSQQYDPKTRLWTLED